MLDDMNLLVDPVLVMATSLSLASLLLAAATHKWRNLQQFVMVLSGYGVLPDRLNTVAGRLVPCVEAMLALGLLNPATRPLSGLLVAALMLSYGAAMAFTLKIGRRLPDCGCSLGQHTQRVSAGLVWRNAGLAMLALNLVQATGVRDMGLYDWATIIFSALIGGAFYALTNTLIANQVSTRELFHD